MKLLGGTYGEGTVSYWSFQRELQINPKSAWMPKTRLISEITHFEDINNQTTSSLGKAGIGAAAGFLLAGPLAGIIGLGLGASGGSSTKFVFGIGFSNGDAIMVGANAKDYMEFKSAISPQLSETQNRATKTVSKSTVKAKKTAKKSSKLSIIDGRGKKSAPEPNGKLAKQISSLLTNAKTGSNEEEFFELAESYKKAFNDFKWQYFDQLLSDNEMIKCVQMVVAYAYDQKTMWKREVERHQDSVDNLWNPGIKRLEEESKKFFASNDVKSKLARDKEHKAELLNVHIPAAKQSEQKWKKLIPVFEKIGAELIGKEAVEQGTKIYLNKSLGYDAILKSNNSLMLNFGKKFFQDIQIEAADANAEDEPQTQTKSDISEFEKRLEKLTALLEKKLISKAEFNKKKKEIIDQI